VDCESERVGGAGRYYLSGDQMMRDGNLPTKLIVPARSPRESCHNLYPGRCVYLHTGRESDVSAMLAGAVSGLATE
jgi:hypothetical protein